MGHLYSEFVRSLLLLKSLSTFLSRSRLVGEFFCSYFQKSHVPFNIFIFNPRCISLLSSILLFLLKNTESIKWEILLTDEFIS